MSICIHTFYTKNAMDIAKLLSCKRSKLYNFDIYTDVQYNKITCVSNNTKKLNKIISATLAKYIINNYEFNIVSDIIRKRYCFFYDIEYINRLYFCLISRYNYFSNKLFVYKKQKSIKKAILKYLEGYKEIFIDSFVTFRLYDYKKILENNISNVL